jgi:hypothetical protein
MKSLKIFALLTLVSVYSFAMGFGVGYTLGAVGYFDISEKLAFRSGVMYTQRPLKVTNELTKDSATVSMTYFDIPAGLMLKFEDWMGVYAGVALSVNLDKSSDNTNVVKLVDVKSLVVPFQMGVTFKFMPELGLNLYFEQFGDVAEGLKSYRSVGANLLFTME